MKRLLLAVAVVAIARPSAGGGEPPQPSVDHLLTAIDFVPARVDLDAAMGPTPLQELLQRTGSTIDPGIRVRAIRALAQYPSPEAHAKLVDLVASPLGSTDGEDVVLRRAALEALAEIGTPDDVAVITPWLSVEGAPGDRDIRAAAAHALGTLGATSARPALLARLEVENVGQVRVAITEALRELAGGM